MFGSRVYISLPYWLILGNILISSRGFLYHGCYMNINNDTLEYEYTAKQTTLGCFLTCISADQGFTYAATQTKPLSCFCGNHVLHNNSYPDSYCNTPCPTKSTDLCGGDNMIAVYDITDESVPVVIRKQNQQVASESTDPPIEQPCKCLPDLPKNDENVSTSGIRSRDELMRLYHTDLKELRENLTVPVKNTSAYKNSKRSANDNRTSSMLMGWVGGLIICLPVILVVLSDVIELFNKKGRRMRKVF